MPDTTDNAKLLPCPFCGHRPATGRANDGHMWIACETKGCGIAETYMSKQHDALLAIWNRRSDPTALASANALNERLREELRGANVYAASVAVELSKLSEWASQVSKQSSAKVDELCLYLQSGPAQENVK